MSIKAWNVINFLFIYLSVHFFVYWIIYSFVYLFINFVLIWRTRVSRYRIQNTKYRKGKHWITALLKKWKIIIKTNVKINKYNGKF